MLQVPIASDHDETADFVERFVEQGLRAGLPCQVITARLPRSAPALEGTTRSVVRFAPAEEAARMIRGRSAPASAGSAAARLLAWQGALQVYVGRDWVAGYEALERALHLARRSRDALALAWALSLDGFARRFPLGEFDAAEELLLESARLFDSAGASAHANHVRLQHSFVCLARGEVEGAERLLLSVTPRPGSFTSAAQHLTRVRLALECGRLDDAANLLSQMAAAPAQLEPLWRKARLDLSVAIGSARLDDDYAGLRRYVQHAPGLYAPEILVSLARAAATRGTWAEARELLLEADDICEAGGCRFWHMQVQFHRASLIRQERRTHTPLVRDHLQGALAHSRAHGYDAFWLRQDPASLVPLLADAVALGVQTDATRDIALRLPTIAVPVLRRLTGDRRKAVRVAARSLLKHRTEGTRVEIRTLGGLSIRSDGELISVPGRMPVRIFAILAARPGRLFSIDELCDTLYEGLDGDHARRNLLDHCRRIGALVRRKADGWVLETSNTVWLDAEEFDHLVIESRHLHGRDRAVQLRRALDLYQGPFLAGIPLQDQSPRDRRRSLAALELEARRSLEAL